MKAHEKRLRAARRAVWGKDCTGCKGELAVECRDLSRLLDDAEKMRAALGMASNHIERGDGDYDAVVSAMRAALKPKVTR